MTEGNFVDYVKIYVFFRKGKKSSHLQRKNLLKKWTGGDGGRGVDTYILKIKSLGRLFHLKIFETRSCGSRWRWRKFKELQVMMERSFIEVPLETVVKDQKSR